MRSTFMRPEFPEHDSPDHGITIHRLRGHFGPRALTQLSRMVGHGPDERLLVQYVPHAFGFRAMNLPFCLWLFAHGRKFGGATIMFHEVQLGILPGDPARYRVIDAVTRVMARLAARSAVRIFVTAPIWEPLVRRYVSNERLIAWMPVPSTVPVIHDCARIAAARCRWSAGGRVIVGHFGAYPPAIAEMLRAVVPKLLTLNSSVVMLLIGANGESFRRRLITENPALANRVIATGVLSPDEVSMAISASEILVQPYPDGVTTRRTSMMAALEHSRPIVTTRGQFTEPLWEQSDAVAMVEAGDAGVLASAVGELLDDPRRRCHYASAGKALYANRFDVSHTIKALRGGACA